VIHNLVHTVFIFVQGCMNMSQPDKKGCPPQSRTARMTIAVRTIFILLVVCCLHIIIARDVQFIFLDKWCVRIVYAFLRFMGAINESIHARCEAEAKAPNDTTRVLKQNHHQDNSKMQILVRTPTSCVRRQYVVTNPSIPEYLEMNSARGAKVRR
jgi:hypothetical protein